MKDLTTTDANDLLACEEIIERGKKHFVEVGLALTEIRERKLYRNNYPTFEDYCQQKWGWSRQRTSQLEQAANAIATLPKTLSTMVDTERAARELSKVPEQARESVVKSVLETGKKPTSETIKNASLSLDLNSDKSSVTLPEKPVVELDKVGRAVPQDMVELWNDHSAQEILTNLSRAKAALDRIMREPTISWVEVNLSGVLVDLQKVWVEVERAKPYAVCPYCQGTNRKNCTRCKTWGFCSEFNWRTAVRKDMKNLVMKGVQNATA